MKKKIFLTADQVSRPSTGLYHFTIELVKQLIDQNPEDYRLHFLVPKDEKKKKIFGQEAYYHTKTLLNVAKWMFSEQYDLIHYMQQHPTLVKPHKIKGKKILTIHDLNYLYEYPEASPHYQYNYHRLKKWMDCSDQIVAISNFTAMDIARIYDYPIDKIKIIYNGVNKPVMIPDHMLALHTPKVEPQRPFLFTIGTVLFKKNFHVLPGMMRNLDFDLVIGGRIDDCGSEYLKILEEECKRFSISKDRIHILGELSEVDKQWYYKNCTGFVFPSLAEGFGLPALEAMHYNKPVFLSTRTALPEIGGDIAYYFEDFAPEAMSSTVELGLKDFEEFNRAEQIPAWLERFSWKNAANAYMELYDEMLQR